MLDEKKRSFLPGFFLCSIRLPTPVLVQHCLVSSLYVTALQRPSRAHCSRHPLQLSFSKRLISLERKSQFSTLFLTSVSYFLLWAKLTCSPAECPGRFLEPFTAPLFFSQQMLRVPRSIL